MFRTFRRQVIVVAAVGLLAAACSETTTTSETTAAPTSAAPETTTGSTTASTDTAASSTDAAGPSAAVKWALDYVGGTAGAVSGDPVKIGFASSSDLAPDAEIALEVDPRITTEAHLQTLRELGFNRLSMGVQDFDKGVQTAIHRRQSLQLTADFVAMARNYGFDSLNMDLIYGLPAQSDRKSTRLNSSHRT